MQTNETVITSLAKQWINKERTIASAGIELQNLASIGYMDALDMLKAERKKLINIQMQMELMEEQEDRDNERFDSNHTSELASRWAE
jgi:hypothetical protein|tara:strand:+ start:462 stop:722 length:261 start_codon:yes stop_codon:yes gene_type:complete